MLLHAAMRKHGVEKFHIAALWSGHIPLKRLGDLERFFIRSFQSQRPNGYNITGGGCGTLGVKQTAEHIARRIASKAWYKQHSPETRAKMRGRKVSAAGRAKMREAWKNRATSYTPSTETREKIRQRHLGRIVSEETKAKMRANHFKTITAEHKAKIGAAMKGNKFRLGKPHTAETIEKLRVVNKENRLRWLREHNGRV